MNRRKFMTGLLGVAVVTPLVTKSLGDPALERAIDAKTQGMSMYEANAYRMGWHQDRLKVEYIPPHEFYVGAGGSVREKSRDILAKWYGSKIDELVFKGLYHG